MPAPKVNLTTEGFVKILADAKTDRVLGVHILGPDAGQYDRRGGDPMEFGALAEDIGPHLPRPPDADEAIKEARWLVAKRAINY